MFSIHELTKLYGGAVKGRKTRIEITTKELGDIINEMLTWRRAATIIARIEIPTVDPKKLGEEGTAVLDAVRHRYARQRYEWLRLLDMGKK